MEVTHMKLVPFYIYACCISFAFTVAWVVVLQIGTIMAQRKASRRLIQPWQFKYLLK